MTFEVQLVLINTYKLLHVRFQVLTAASMMFRTVFWDILPCKMIVDRRFRGAYCLLMMYKLLHHHHFRVASVSQTSDNLGPLHRLSVNIQTTFVKVPTHESTFK
jgi:hypothetical protein